VANIRRGACELAKCPKCGETVVAPVKIWPVPSRRTDEESVGAKHVVGIFECPNCSARFRAAVDVETEVEEKANIKNMVERIRGIKGELMQTLRNLREKIKTLETERSSLMIEIEKLRKVAESRVDALENEVGTLREEVRSLRELLGYAEEAEE
jgi:regulator of replication initiation timing/predicted RNA-binding Zn-ribbon protein involved in translation (DUF1610 family)